jgi:hypothetical protein
MPKGPNGEKRPADAIGNAVHIMRIATGQVEDAKRDVASQAARKGGLQGGKARAKVLSAKQRKEIAKKAAAARWGTKTDGR